MKPAAPAVAVALLLALQGRADAAPPPADDGAARMVAALQGDTPLVDDLRGLADDVGGRPAGSPAYEQAAAWAASRMRDAGLEGVRVDPFVVGQTWIPGKDAATITAPTSAWQPDNARTLRLAAMPLAPPTPDVGLEADVVSVGSGDEKGFVAAGERARGAWLLVGTKPMRSLEDLFAEYTETGGIFARAKAAGAAGILWTSTRPGRLLYRHPATLDDSVAPVPAAVVEREGAERIARLLASGRGVRVRVTLTGETVPAKSSANVVGEVRGRERPEEIVVLGGHLDSWDLGRGALDNGCNAALVLDVARQAAALARAGVRPRRTLRFVLYGAEELGMIGSMADARAHRGSLDAYRAVVILDEGTGRVRGFSLGGREDAKDAAAQALLAAGALGPFEQTTDAFVGTDNYDYLVEGIPTFVANQEDAPYLPDYHAESDTFDKADLAQLRKNAAVAGGFVWALAGAASLPPRQTRAEVESLLKATGLDQQMRTFGLWDDFASGARGRQPLR